MKGKIVLIQFPFDDLSSSKVRHAYCLTNKIGGYQHIIFALITSRIPENPLRRDIILRSESPDFMISGLRQSSAIRLDHLVTLRSSLIQRELGSLSLKTQTLIIDILSDLIPMVFQVSGHTATIGLSWVTLGESAGKYNLLNGS
ncbi:hypothetical protein MSj_02903 [Microcystis aeruginosa Sj]|jgi:mRNA interferase MazF|uniref:PemK-like protein n=1 Tax=Microcystis aeruginosa Sj TaxID=1979544 RepID=A0A2Z6UQD1_MICAE|nr:type II toxin-antitoxin system PemK/MazF family toxin [Microcystis sp. LE19-4.1E]GBL11399.1 hypothetical protein MSj_02903 [Microcystis aeruginosa Sj]